MANPILAFSATRRMRSLRTLIVVLAYVGVLLVIAAIMLRGMFGSSVSLYTMQRSVTCYAVLAVVQFVMLILIGPAMASGAIAGERERQTLELLLVTNTRSFRIAVGKVMESFALLALLIVCGMPVMCLTMVAGGVTLVQILVSMLFLLAVAFGTVSVGLFSSALTRSTLVSTVMSYVFIGVIGVVTALPMLFGYPVRITDAVYDSAKFASMPPGQVLGMISPLLMANPGYGLTALLEGQTSALSSYMTYREHGRLLCTYLLMTKAGCQTVALVSSGIIALAGCVLTAVSALLIRPSRRHKR